jgi:adenylate cyclase
VGTSASGLLDIRATPLDRTYPGVEVQAAALDTILAQNAISIPLRNDSLLSYLSILCAGLAATLAFGFAGPLIYLPIAGVLVGASVMLSRYFFREEGLFVSPLYTVMTTVLLGAFLLLLRFWQEAQQKNMLRTTFSHYVSPEVVKRITKERGDLLAGEEQELSILFTDIRGFTSISEKLSPQQIVNLLSRYFTPMTAIVREREGTLDKFIGDALMAFWNAPLDVSAHAVRAVDAVLFMQEKLLVLNEEIRAEFGVDIRMGVGIHTGPAYVGNMGSSDLVNYTLIGDNVNLASRLEGLCPQYGVPVVVSGETMAACGDTFAFQYLDTIRVKGKMQPVQV